jgi:hypothetical protein
LRVSVRYNSVYPQHRKSPAEVVGMPVVPSTSRDGRWAGERSTPESTVGTGSAQKGEEAAR